MPFVSDLSISGFNENKWNTFIEKLESVERTASQIMYPGVYLNPVDIGIVSPTGGSKIAEKISTGVSLVSMIYDNDISSMRLQGWWSQGNGWGSGVLTDINGNAFLVTAEGDIINVTTMGGKAVAQNCLISEEEVSFVKSLMEAGVTAAQLKSLLTGTSQGSPSSPSGSSSSVNFVNAGVVDAETGGEVIVEKTSNGLQVIKMTLGGVTIVGPWTREGTFGYGLLTDMEGNVYSVRVQDDKIFSNKLDTGEGLVERNNVSADIDQIVAMIRDLGKTADAINNPYGEISDVKNRISDLEVDMAPLINTANITYAKQRDFSDLIQVIGTTDKINGKSLLQTILGILSDVKDLKVAAGLDTGTSETVDDESEFNYETESVSKDHEALLRVIRGMARKGDSTVTGDILITQGLISATTKSLPNWKAGFISDAVEAADIDVFLKSFGVDLDNQDTGSILGKDAGSSVTYKPDDVLYKDQSVERYYPATDYKFENEALENGSYTMRTAEVPGIRVFVQQPDELSETEQAAMSNVIWWYIPESLKLVEKATSLSFNSSTSKLSRIRLKSTNGFVTFDKKGLVIVYDSWDKGVNVATPANDDLVTVSFTAVNADTKKAAAVVLDINGNYYSAISEDRGVGINDAPLNLDRAICRSITKAVLGVNISNYDTLPLWFKEGLILLTDGADDIKGVDIKELLKNETRLNKALSVYDYSNYTAEENKKDPAAAGYVFLRYILNAIGKTNMEGVTDADASLSHGARNLKVMISNMAGSKLSDPDIILDDGIRSIGSKYRTAGAVKADFLTDLQRSVNKQENYTTFLENNCDIILFNEDDGSILGYDAGGEDIIRREDIIWEDSGRMISYPVNSLHLDDYKAYYRYVDNTLFLFPDRDKMSDEEEYIMALVATHHLPAATGLIKTLTGLSAGKNVTKGMIRQKNSDIKVYDEPFVLVCLDNNAASPYTLTESDSPVKAVWTKNETTDKVETLNLVINSVFFGHILQENLSGKSMTHDNIPYLDTLILQELAKAAIAANLTGEYPLWFTMGLSKLISGADKEMVPALEAVLSSVERTEQALNPDIKELSGFTAATDPAAAGYALLRYLTKKTTV